MGQYYLAIILADKGTDTKKEFIRTYVKPHSYNQGAKLTEHSYLDTDFMHIIESLICPQGMFYKCRLVWAGDYADGEAYDEDCNNLYNLTQNQDNCNKLYYGDNPKIDYYQYIVNHTQKLYIDKKKIEDNGIHPLPLLTSEGNGKGGGDYNGTNEHLCGTWARDTVSMEHSIPEGYNELVCDFVED